MTSVWIHLHKSTAVTRLSWVVSCAALRQLVASSTYSGRKKRRDLNSHPLLQHPTAAGLRTTVVVNFHTIRSNRPASTDEMTKTHARTRNSKHARTHACMHACACRGTYVKDEKKYGGNHPIPLPPREWSKNTQQAPAGTRYNSLIRRPPLLGYLSQKAKQDKTEIIFVGPLTRPAGNDNHVRYGTYITKPF